MHLKEMSSLRTSEEITEIYHRNVNSVFGVSMLYLKNRTDAEDMVQNVFFKFIDKQPVFKDKNHEKGWFITVTKNMCKNSLLSPWKSKRNAFDDADLITYNQKFYEEGSLINALKKLNDKYRIVIYLYYYEELSAREISEILDEKEGTVRTWLTRGREKLRILIGDDENEI